MLRIVVDSGSSIKQEEKDIYQTVTAYEHKTIYIDRTLKEKVMDADFSAKAKESTQIKTRTERGSDKDI